MGKCTIQILSGGFIQEPVVIEGVEWETARKGEPGKLTFTCIKTPFLSFSEGAQVKMSYDGKDVFFGYVFQKQRNKDQHIKVTCYDQLRYLKNKTSYQMYGVRADQVVSRLAQDFQLKCGNIPNTGYVIPKFEKADQTLFDMILDALDATVMATGELYYLYDDCGKIMLKNIKDSLLPDVLIYDESAEDFDYSTSIDTNTYNRIVIVDSENKSERNVVKVEDRETQQQWGVLQYFISEKSGANTKAKAEALLKMYNQVSRALSIKGQFGDVRVRAGSMVYLDLHLGDMIAKQTMVVERAKHVFEDGDYYMDLTLIDGRGFYA